MFETPNSDTAKFSIYKYIDYDIMWMHYALATRPTMRYRNRIDNITQYEYQILT